MVETFYKNERGNSLIEVLAAVTIFSLIVIPMMSFFIQAYNNTNRNEKSTVSINVARGVLEFMENQDFSELKARMVDINGDGKGDEYNIYIGLFDGNEADPNDSTKKIQVYKFLDKTTYENPTVPDSDKIKQIQINNVEYNTFAKLKPNVGKPNYFIDIEVFVWNGEDKYSPPLEPSLKGKIVNETIR